MVKKILIAALLLAAILAGGTGCMFNSLQTNESHIHDLALSYMEEKYGEPFHFESLWGDSMTGTKEILVSCASLPGEKILVQIENYQNDNRVFRDNCIAVKYQKETAEFFRSCAAEVFGDVRIFHNATKDVQSETLPADASFEEYLADGNAKIILRIEVKAAGFASKDQIAALADKIAACCPNIIYSVIVVEDEIFGTLSLKELEDRVALQTCVYSSVTNIENGTIKISSSWED